MFLRSQKTTDELQRFEIRSTQCNLENFIDTESESLPNQPAESVLGDGSLATRGESSESGPAEFILGDERLAQRDEETLTARITVQPPVREESIVCSATTIDEHVTPASATSAIHNQQPTVSQVRSASSSYLNSLQRKFYQATIYALKSFHRCCQHSPVFIKKMQIIF